MATSIFIENLDPSDELNVYISEIDFNPVVIPGGDFKSISDTIIDLIRLKTGSTNGARITAQVTPLSY